MKTDFQDLLVKTSRTFALSIPYLPEPVRLQVTLAYLIFRIADTFEDAATWPQQQRIEALGAFGRLLQTSHPEEAERLARQWQAEVPIDHDGYQELIEKVPAVLEAYFELDPAARQTIGEHALRTIEGMGEYVARTDADGELVLRDLEDLQQYCYIVAGIVGEMLTELFLAAAPDLERAEGLRAPLPQLRRSVAAGEHPQGRLLRRHGRALLLAAEPGPRHRLWSGAAGSAGQR